MKTLSIIVLTSWLTLSAVTGGYEGIQNKNYILKEQEQTINQIHDGKERELALKKYNEQKNNILKKVAGNVVFGGGGAILGITIGAIIAGAIFYKGEEELIDCSSQYPGDGTRGDYRGN